MRLLMVGTNHRCAQVDIREKLAITPQNVDDVYARFARDFPGCELVVLSTCNRSELYVAKPAAHSQPDATSLRQLLANVSGLAVNQVTTATIEREQEQAAQHLFRTASGLDSRILGEPQILGQIRRAYELAVTKNLVGSTTHQLFQQALATAKRLRTRTGLGTSRHSVGTVAIDFAKQVFAQFHDKNVLVLGAGEMIQTVMPHLCELNPKNLWLVNRTAARAQSLADRFDIGQGRLHPGGVRAWDDLAPLLVEADFVISCTAAQEPVIDLATLKQAAKKNRHRPMCLADLGVPRDIEPACNSIRNVYLYNIDDLQQVIADNQHSNSQIAEQCETEINAAAQAVVSQVLHRDIGVLIRVLREDLHALGDLEQSRTVQRLSHCHPGADHEEIEAILAEHNHRLINKILHVPLRQLNQHDGRAPLGFYAAALRRLFNLEQAATESLGQALPPLEPAEQPDGIDTVHPDASPANPANGNPTNPDATTSEQATASLAAPASRCKSKQAQAPHKPSI